MCGEWEWKAEKGGREKGRMIERGAGGREGGSLNGGMEIMEGCRRAGRRERAVGKSGKEGGRVQEGERVR